MAWRKWRFWSFTTKKTMIEHCGAYIGEGLRRIVYQDKTNPNYVIKFLKKLEDPHNKIEFWNWENWKYDERGKWFAPCHSISEDGRFLVQVKVELLDNPPEQIPEWIKVLRDYEVGGNKSRPRGIYNSHPVLVDYGDQIL